MRDLTFIRWGNLTPSKQLGYGRDSFHSPPAKRGLYAFVDGLIEPFLLGGFEFREDRHTWVRKEDGSLIKMNREIDDEHNEELKDYVAYDKFWDCWDLKGDYCWVKKTKLDPFKQYTLDSDDKFEQYPDNFIAKLKKPKKFKHYGNIWTHYQPKVKDMLSVHNDSWYLVEYETFVKLYQKKHANIMALRKSKGWFTCLDDCEVFIEKIIPRKY